jgi:urease accessory protein
MLELLKTIWQADSGFPSGAFAFSNGIEGVAAHHPRFDRNMLRETIVAILRQRWATFDRVALLRAFRADGDLTAIAAIDRDVDAATFGATMREGSRRNGGSFLAMHARLADPTAIRLRDGVRDGALLGHLAPMQGTLWRKLGLDERSTLAASSYAVASGSIAAAVRLGVVGAIDGQRILQEMLPLIDDLSADPVSPDAALSSFLPFIEIAAARHERAHLRLFAN